jgi:ABC transport system ATP-binding/permease protein
VLEAVFDSENELIQAIRQYEEALLWPDREEKMQAALSKMDDLKAWDFEAKIKEILFKLNITELDQTIATLSGGQKKRLALAKLLIEEPEFLLLDEPTNHLDMDMIEWLENYLQQAKLTIFMVTHDRYFLERICNQILELENGHLYRYSGNYSDFLEKRAMRHENESTVLDKNRKLFKKELEWIRRMPKARGTKAKARVDKFFEIKEASSKQQSNQDIQIDIKGSRLGSKILECHYISKRFGDLKIVEDFNYKFKKRERVGIVGKNGIGKTTFLKMLTKEIRPDSGKVVVGATVEFGYYTQDGIQLKEDKRVIDVVRDIAEYLPLDKGQKLTAPQLLERFLFTRPQQQVYVSQLSGGERRRLYLLTVLMKNPNFLILDEPTNDLDIITLNMLEEWLSDFPGCIIMVSHDRYFVDKLVDHLFIFEGDGSIKDFNGNHLDYRNYMREKERAARSLERNVQQKQKNAVPKSKENSSGLTYNQRKEMRRLEKEISKLEEQKAEMHERFSGSSIPHQEIEKLSVELGELNKKLEEKELRWMELAELD